MGARSVLKPLSRENKEPDPIAIWSGKERVCESGVDWLTVTCSEPDSRDRFREVGVALVHNENQLGEKIAPFTFMGMEGLKGGGAGFVESDAMAMIRLSGRAAHDHWRQAYEYASNCSRIDLQVTVANCENPNSKILDHHAEALRFSQTWLRPPTVDIRMSNRTGNTLYLNQRTSAKFGRCYNKGVESKLAYYANCLRYELQCNGRFAKRMVHSIAQRNDSQTDAVRSVQVFFREKRLSLPWRSVDGFLLGSPRKRTTASRRLSWLRSQVRGCVRELCDSGMYDEVIDALALRELDVGQLVQSLERGNE